MCRLCILRAGSEASANGPDRLICNDHPCRIEQVIDLAELHIHLCKHSIETPLTDRLRLTNAEHTFHPSIQNVLQLGGQRFVAVHREDTKLSTTLRVPNEHLRNAHGLHLLHRHLPCVSPQPSEVAVLWRDQGPVPDTIAAVGYVQGRWADIHIALAGITCVDVGEKSIKLLHGRRVAFPVASNDRPANGDLPSVSVCGLSSGQPPAPLHVFTGIWCQGDGLGLHAVLGCTPDEGCQGSNGSHA
mmetsp:Transcript_88443/g.153527  ORF Transcript_88443/g.153527 Transcript_88443/m.153527 type:complete len:244 (-) Transcript_88443:382-1113(-)